MGSGNRRLIRPVMASRPSTIDHVLDDLMGPISALRSGRPGKAMDVRGPGRSATLASPLLVLLVAP